MSSEAASPVYSDMSLPLRILCLLLPVFFAAGCTGLEPAVISAGASAAQSGATFFTQGRFTTMELAPFEDAVRAVRAAAEEMALALVEDEPGDDRVRMVYEDQQKQSIVVVVQRRTETVTRIHADVGTFGENGLASLLMRQVSLRLHVERQQSGALVD